MVWKVYHISTGRILKAGFDSDDEAQEWLLERAGDEDDWEIDEMDDDEWEEYDAEQQKRSEGEAVEEEEEEADDVVALVGLEGEFAEEDDESAVDEDEFPDEEEAEEDA